MVQLTLDDALRARDEGMARVEENAGAAFRERAKEFVLHHLATNGESSCEDITDACKAAGIAPHNDKAFGPVFLSLSRQKRILRVGMVARRKGHGAPGGSIWKLA